MEKYKYSNFHIYTYIYELALWCGGHHIHITVTALKAVVFSLRTLHISQHFNATRPHWIVAMVVNYKIS